MGNKLGKRRQVVNEKYTRPQGLYQIKDVDYKKLRKLILESKLAPCYPGGDECDCGHLEECPICFLYYPTLNRSRCCMKSICTECFLQMKNPNSTRPTQCPFCKTSNYAVEYRGVKSKEERGMEQIEEQKVIEAKIRMRQLELQEEEERKHKRQEVNSSTGVTHIESSEPGTSGWVQVEEVTHSTDSSSAPAQRQSQHPRQNRDDNFEIDLEDIMVMEAIWLSIQENGRPGHSSGVDDHYAAGGMAPQLAGSSSSPSGGLACAVAALAERQQTGGESSSHRYTDPVTPDTLPSSSMSTSKTRLMRRSRRRPPVECCTADELYKSRMAAQRDRTNWVVNHGVVFASSESDEYDEDATNMPPPPYEEAGSSGVCSDDNEEDGGEFTALSPPPPQPLPYEPEGGTPGPIVPETFEEQMMLAMAVSLAEAQARATVQGVAWQ